MPIPRLLLAPEDVPAALELLGRYPYLVLEGDGDTLRLLIPDAIEGGFLVELVVPAPLVPGLEGLFTARTGPALKLTRGAREALERMRVIPSPLRVEVPHGR